MPKEQDVDLATLYPGLQGGTYVLYAVPDDKKAAVRRHAAGRSRSAATNAPAARPARSSPGSSRLRYAVMDTDAGPMTLAFDYDVAPNTVDNFLRLSEEGYYDGIAFHRIIPHFVLQAGDPLSLDADRAGQGGPGYTINEEFNPRPHVRGALSMARQGDEGEARGAMPGYAAANSASSQFFICLDYDRTSALDGKYTVFGQVTDGLDVMDKLAATPTGRGDRPVNPPLIKTLTVKPVTADHNPYPKLPVAKPD